MAYGARPVPQNIMSVEFKLFDFMTVKQFLVSFGLLLFCMLLFWLLPGAWRIIIPGFLLLTGVVVIFVPFNGEPFQEFISSYLEAMILPQRRVWNRKGVIVQSAYGAAKRYQYGDVTNENDVSKFRYIPQQEETPEQRELDKQEDLFLQQKQVIFTNPKTQTLEAMREAQSQGTNISSKSINAHAPLKHKVNETNDTHSIPGTQIQQHQSPEVGVKEQNGEKLSVENEEILVHPDKKKKADDGIVPKNYIFGSVEDSNGKSLINTLIIISQDGNEIENLYTNANGDFQTHYEYPEGEYVVQAFENETLLSQAALHHDPVDPLPLILRPANNVPEYTPESLPQDHEQTEQGIYMGDYDSSKFSLGNSYDELELEPVSTNISNSKEVSTAERINDREIQPELTDPEKLSEFEEIPEQLPIDGKFQQTEPAQEITVSPQHTKYEVVKTMKPNSTSQGQTTIPIYNANAFKTYDFSALPNSNASFNKEYISIPNTINGQILNHSNKFLEGVIVMVSDINGKIVSSARTDDQGIFYLTKQLSAGNYRIDFAKEGYSFWTYYISLKGSVIEPKFVQSEN